MSRRWEKGMRDSFFDALYETAKKDRDIILLSSDTGAICHDEFKAELPGQYINVGIAEQNMIGVAAGLSMSGKKVFCYAIVPFVTLRCLEQIRVDLICMDLPVNLIGIGCGYDYSTLGPTHHGTDDIAAVKALYGVAVYSPSDSLMASALPGFIADAPGPKYVRLDRTGTPLVYGGKEEFDLAAGFKRFGTGEDLAIITTGRMVYRGLRIADTLSGHGMDCSVIDMFKLHPVDYRGDFKDALESFRQVVTLEEHYLQGGIGSSVSDFIYEESLTLKLLKIGIENSPCRVYGDRDHLLGSSGLDEAGIIEKILGWTGAG